MTTFYCLRFETLPPWKTRSPYLYPPGTGRPGYTPRHCVPFSSLSTTGTVTVEVFDPAPTRDIPKEESLATELLTSRKPEYRSPPRTLRFTLFFRCHEKCLPNRWLAIRWNRNVLIEPLTSNELPIWLHYSGFQAVLTEPLPSNGHICHNSTNSESKLPSYHSKMNVTCINCISLGSVILKPSFLSMHFSWV
jgi:hypothetical protein